MWIRSKNSQSLEKPTEAITNIDEALDIVVNIVKSKPFYFTLAELKDQLKQDKKTLMMYLKHHDKIDKCFTNMQHILFPKEERYNHGFEAHIGAQETGKTFNCQEEARKFSTSLGGVWDDPNIPTKAIVHRIIAREDYTSHHNEPCIFFDEHVNLPFDEFKICADIGKLTSGFIRPVKYKVEQHEFNHAKLYIATNNWVTDYYYNKFQENEINWQAFIRRCSDVWLYPRFKVDNEDHPTSVLYHEGQPVLNRVESINENTKILAQRINITSILKNSTYAEALDFKVAWENQLLDKTDEEIALLKHEKPPFDHTYGGKYKGHTAWG